MPHGKRSAGNRKAWACEHTDRPHCAHGMCRQCYAKSYYKLHATAIRTRVRAHGREKIMGLSRDDAMAMAEEQGFQCAICQAPGTHRTLHADHDHATGLVRGLLCGDCNKALGLFHDDPNNLTAAIAYLAKAATLKET